MSESTITTKDLAEILRISTRSVNLRANRSVWKYKIMNKRGDRRYYISHLPEDIRDQVTRYRPTVPKTSPKTIGPNEARLLEWARLYLQCKRNERIMRKLESKIDL